MDPESQKVVRRRGSCLDAFLVISVIFLFLSLAAIVAGGLMVMQNLQDKPSKSAIIGSAPHTGYKQMENFVYLQAKTSDLSENVTMQWAPVSYLDGQSVGNNFKFNKERHMLELQQDGVYFMYVELNFTCTFKCNASLIRVNVDDNLNCEVQLPTVTDSTPVTKKCWAVSRIHKKGLVSQLTVPKQQQYWKLEMLGSGFGMFLVG